MNLIKLILGVVLLGLVASYPLMGSLGLAALGLPFPVILILGVLAVLGGAKLIYDGVSE